MEPGTNWTPLDIAVIGGGVGGTAASIALRRAGNKVTVYERADFAGEVGASISCAANGMKWLHEWQVNIEKGDGVYLKQLINRDWKTGEPVSVVDLSDYEEKWGQATIRFHRQDMHKMLMDCALSKEGDGVPVKLVVNHKCEDIDTNSGTVVFTDGSSVKHDVIIGSDGIGSAIRKLIGIQVEKRPAESSCLHANVTSEEAVALGLPSYGEMNSAIEYWGGHGSLNKIVLSPCRNSSLLSYYCFFPREKGDYSRQTWTSEDRPVGELLSPYPDLDPEVYGHLKIGQEIRPWRLWVHEPYSHWQKGLACIMGDAAHPMMPDQSQGACTALEDAAALGLLFSKDFYAGSVEETLKLYEKVRMPRATKVQAASARARENIHERIGFSDNTDNKLYAVNDESSKLTIAEMNSYDMRADILSKWPVSAQTSVTTNGR
ncbi:salicylate hydroxylase-like protein [Zymoseptoria tritici IPO323]|uniref:Salicylate hydroxylase-like protein n=1 Tax=Zymoseptoria tritici (strain CBS 115943 / IPO323) TaxID=336722 RepID=F9XCT2_ZYMTI|nr:salicylate hydroxylase-like protein [Zymoseptoria tritici IPO323]EGP86363.1 salicylate hydroxylase-like protein [Zymoseptoria tritici IPO323]